MSKTTGCATSTTSSACVEQQVVADADLPVGKNLILSASFVKDGQEGPGVATGILSLYIGDKKVGEGRIKTQPGMFGIGGGLTVGRSERAVTSDLPRRAALALHGRHDQDACR